MNYAPKIWKETQTTTNPDNVTHSFRLSKEVFPSLTTLYYAWALLQ